MFWEVDKWVATGVFMDSSQVSLKLCCVSVDSDDDDEDSSFPGVNLYRGRYELCDRCAVRILGIRC